MSAEDEAGRQPLVLVEIDYDFCELRYGESPCTAAIGSTGTRKCYNTRATCQDPDNYDRGTKTITFSKAHVDQPRDVNWIPLLRDVDTVPTRLNVGGGSRDSEPLGQRASITATFEDAPYSDLLTDKYRDERISGAAQSSGEGFDPLDRGTFWSKFTKRQPYYQNRRMRVREGYVGQDPADMRTRHYFIDEIRGPDANGRVRVKAKDVLKLADNDRAVWPERSPGELNAGVDEGDTSLTVKGAEVSDYDPDLQGEGALRIGDEVIEWSNLSVNGDLLEFSSLIRGAENTEESSHDEDDSVQRCQRYTDTPINTVLEDILSEGAGVPGEFLPTADWQAERDRWLQAFDVTTLLTEPFGATELLAELTEQCLFYIWWDELDQEIKFKGVRPVDRLRDEAAVEIDDETDVIAGTFEVEEEPDERMSQVWTLFSQIDPTEDVDEFDNYRRLRVFADANAESADQYGEKRIKRVYARWLTRDDQALPLNRRLIARYRDNPTYVKISLDAKDRGIKVGSVIDLSTRQIQDDTGAQETRRYQVIRVKETEPSHRQNYTLQRFQFAGRYAFVEPNDEDDFSSVTADDRDPGGFIAPDSGEFANGSKAYRII